MVSQKPILITGSHRSGTTWVGSMLAASRTVGYIHEPFNVIRPPGICRAKFKHWFTYVCSENESMFFKAIRDTLRFRYDLFGAARSARSVTRLRGLAREFASFLMSRAAHARPLLKDPISLFSAEWLASRFDMDVVVMIRHPAGFASSLEKLNWTFPFSHLLEQPLLMRDHLRPFEAEIREYAAGPVDILDQASLLWRIMHHTIAGYRRRHPEWIFVRHEDLSLDPLRGFECLASRLQVELGRRAKDMILKASDSKNPGDPADPYAIRRYSRATASIWKERLTPAKIRQIRDHVEDVSRMFYSDRDWE